MIEQPAIVISVTREKVILDVQRQSSCEACELSKGCGTGSLGRLMGKRTQQIIIDNDGEFKPGDRVRVAIPEASLVWTSIVVYLSPLLAMFLFGGVGDALLEANELVITLLAIVGLIFGFLISRKFAESGWVKQQRPKVTRSFIDSPNSY